MSKRGQTTDALGAQEDAEFVRALCTAEAATGQQQSPPVLKGDQVWAFQHAAPPPKPVETQNSFTELPVTNNDDPDDALAKEENDMIKALTQLAGRPVRFGKQQAQKKRKGLTLKQISKIAEDVNSGKIQLPDVTLDSNEEWDVLWALVDSGSSVHVVNAEQVFPGAKINKPRPGARPFKVANGGTVPNLGHAAVKARTAEGEDLTINWKNAPVDMPILSTKLLSEGGKAVLYHEAGGSIINPNTCSKSDFIEANGVYFIKLLVPKAMTTKGQPPPTGPPPKSGFAWPAVQA